MKRTSKVAAGILITFELTTRAHHVHVPELAFSYIQHGWSATAEAAHWNSAAYERIATYERIA